MAKITSSFKMTEKAILQNPPPPELIIYYCAFLVLQEMCMVESRTIARGGRGVFCNCSMIFAICDPSYTI